MRTHESGTPNPGRGTFRGCSRGQFSSLDAMFGMAGMALVLVLSFALFSTLFGSVASSLDSKGMDAHSLAAMDELMGKGEPADWQFRNLSSVSNWGIASQDGVLERSKLAALNSTLASNYTLVRERIGLSRYDFSLEVSDFYNGTLFYSMGAGPGNSTHTISIAEPAAMDGALVMVRLRVYG